MIKIGGRRMTKDGFHILTDEGFIAVRVESMGYLDSTNVNIKYIKCLRYIYGIEKKQNIQYD